MSYYAVVVEHPHHGKRAAAFHKEDISFGRSPSCEVVLPLPEISKRHCRVVLRDGRLIIVDFKSKNGTFVNAKRIQSPQVLKKGDRVSVGPYTLTFDDDPRGLPNADAVFDRPFPSTTAEVETTQEMAAPPTPPTPPAPKNPRAIVVAVDVEAVPPSPWPEED